MDKEYVIQNLRLVLPKGIDKAFDEFENKINPNAKVMKDYILLKCRYQEVVRNYHIQFISDETKNVEFNKIRDAYLFLLSNIEEHDISIKKNTNNVIYPTLNNSDFQNGKDFTIQILCLDRLKGKNRIADKLFHYIEEEKDNFEIAVIELALHRFSKDKELRFFENLKCFERKNFKSHYCKRTAKLIECINLISNGSREEIKSTYLESQKFKNISFQELNYISFWEGLILAIFGEFEKSNFIWNNLSGYSPVINNNIYPFVNQSRNFDRLLFKVILGKTKIEDIVNSIAINEYRGLAHFSAVNSRLIRRNEYVLESIIDMAKSLGWTTIPNFQTSWERLMEFEKLIFSNSGTLRD